MAGSWTIVRLDAWAHRAPTPRPVSTSFGTMRDRPSVFVRLETADGAFGWGEIFANWPVAGAEHRVSLLMDDVAELVLGQEVVSLAALFDQLERATRLRALQCGEPGPFRQVIAGIDIAMHDLFARRAGLSLAAWLRDDPPKDVAAYASGIRVQDGPELTTAARANGHGAFKVKVGFDIERDLKDLADIAAALEPGERLFADANQAWDVARAADFARAASALGLGWLEEPIPADAPEVDWMALAKASPVPLAAGENIATLGAFERSLAHGRLGFVQPDIMKWGGITGCLAVADLARAAGVTFCPHYLGGGIGLVASAHLLAAVGGQGLLEVDVNENPLRDAFAPASDRVREGRFALDDAPGLGIETLPSEIDGLCTLHRSRTL